eukprot:TRINITY_DN10161_c0_g1_i1.p1 TRINITY_DN10161_c0_g1~~TRINITY_DN10161_c0_g1_i1.p1  ORF type:complete len:755 (+),score=79.86 TRINITY_DN10161_c0_g1_i1:102-2366(+)
MDSNIGSVFQLLKQLEGKLSSGEAAVPSSNPDNNLFSSFMPGARNQKKSEIYSTLYNGVMREEPERELALAGSFSRSSLAHNSFPNIVLNHLLQFHSENDVGEGGGASWMELSDRVCFPPTESSSDQSSIDLIFKLTSSLSQLSAIKLTLDSGSVSLPLDRTLLDRIIFLLLQLSPAHQSLDRGIDLHAGAMEGPAREITAPSHGSFNDSVQLLAFPKRPASIKCSSLISKCLDLAFGWMGQVDQSAIGFAHLKKDLESLNAAIKSTTAPIHTSSVSIGGISEQRGFRNVCALIDQLSATLPLFSSEISLPNMLNLIRALSEYEMSPLVQPLLTGRVLTFMWLCCLVEYASAQLWEDRRALMENGVSVKQLLWNEWELRWQRTVARLNLLPKSKADHLRHSAITLLRNIPTQFSKALLFESGREAPPVHLAIQRLFEPTLEAICVSVDTATIQALNMSTKSHIIERIVDSVEYEVSQLWSASTYQPLYSLWSERKLDVSVSSQESMASLANMLVQRCRRSYQSSKRSGALLLSVQPATPFRGVDLLDNISWTIMCDRNSMDEQALAEIDWMRRGNFPPVAELMTRLLRLRFKVTRAISNTHIIHGETDKRLSWIKWSVHRVLSALGDYLQMQLHDGSWIEPSIPTTSVDEAVTHTAAWLASLAERCFLTAQHAPINAFFERQFLLAEKLKIIFTEQNDDDTEGLDKLIEHQQRNVSFLVTLLDRMIFSTGAADRYSHYVLLRLQISLSASAMDG